ncbi:MAG: tetratricopeptide repeat protein [Acidobacteriota bacterium]
MFLSAFLALAVTIPALPRLDLRNFAPAVRQQVQKAYDAARLRPRDAAASGQLGMVLAAYRLNDSAVPCLELARQLDPGDKRWTYYLATVQAQRGRHDEAVAHFEEFLRQNPGDLPARLRLAESLFLSGKTALSEQFYERLAQDHPDSAVAHYGLGRARSAQRQFAAAVVPLEQACGLFPAFDAAHYALAQAYRHMGQDENARRQLDLYDPKRRAWPATRDPLQGAIEALNTSGSQRVQKALGLEAAGRKEAAIAELEQALLIDPSLTSAHSNLITLYAKQDQFEKAEQHYRALVAINPNLADSHHNYGVLLLGRQKYSEASEAFRRALEINPHYAAARNNYAYILMTEGNLEEAERNYRIAIADEPGNRQAHFSLGRILVHREKLAEAIEHFLQTLAPDDESTPNYLYALGAAYARLGDRAKALHYIGEARTRAAARGQKELLVSIERDLRTLTGMSVPQPEGCGVFL